jgi:hypothetical protein
VEGRTRLRHRRVLAFHLTQGSTTIRAPQALFEKYRSFRYFPAHRFSFNESSKAEQAGWYNPDSSPASFPNLDLSVRWQYEVILIIEAISAIDKTI